MGRKTAIGVLMAGLLLAAVTVGALGEALAQGQGPEVQYKKETRYDFDDDMVEGELQRPEGDFLTLRTGAKHSSLIKLRLDFIPEIVKSAEDL